jgi:hypothetical protein
MLWIERHGILTIGGLSLGHILYLQHTSPPCTRTPHVEAMDYITACDRSYHREPAQHVHVPALRQPHTRATAHDDDLVKLSGVDSTFASAAGADRARRHVVPDVAAELGLPATTTVYAGTNDTVTVAVAAGRSRRGAGLAIGTTSVLVDDVTDFRATSNTSCSRCGPY